MSRAGFQKYVEVMNRQTLDKKPECQSADILLPHQRTGPFKNPLAIQGPGYQSPEAIFTEEIGADTDTLQRGGSVVPPGASIDANTTASKYLSPKEKWETNTYQTGTQPLDHKSKSSKVYSVDSDPYQSRSYMLSQEGRSYEYSQKPNIARTPRVIDTGLAKSRWAGQNYNSAPISKVGRMIAISPTAVQNHQRGEVEKRSAAPFNKSADKLKHWRLVGTQAPLETSGVETSNFGRSHSTKRDNSVNDSSPNKRNQTQDDGWDKSEFERNHTWAPGLQPSPTKISVPATGRNLEVNTGNFTSVTQDKDLEVGQLKLTDTGLDPRRNWPTELGALKMADEIQTQSPQKNSSDSVSCSTEENFVPKYITDFIQTWIQESPEVKADFIHNNVNGHEDCDVDTLHGTLIEPIEYPKTKCQELMSRSQCEQTSDFFIRQFAAQIARRDPNMKSNRKAAKQATAEVIATETEIPCHLRPTTESDIEAITDIYNQEMANGYKVMDTSPLQQEDFYKIYNQCMSEKAPFVVAVEGRHGMVNNCHQEVVGFALVTAASLGISGSYETLSKCGGKLLVIVKPKYRRKKIGTALIDILITNCTGWYMRKGGYEFVKSIHHNWISTEFVSKSRKWWYLEMEVIIRSGTSEGTTREREEFQWIWNFLESKFDLLLKNYDEKCLCEPRQMEWLDKLTFRRDCRMLGK
ncbi:hypothetical protein O1611_g3087 [Lasiodiplodia mahajangana]|uniref:Uncharacterized protein n=1 Tax=Lasiodiplodia mahajangana TaxID=1108764 RepID=A0ACC2JTF5_9PEZI|nr:hypothetical protein O1611_g3087 [Lasiodiplodia mahajangana]